MHEYEYCVLSIGEEDELSVEQVLEKIEENGWRFFESKSKLPLCSQEDVVKEILQNKYADWGMFDEGDAAFIAVKEIGEDKDIEVHQVSIEYILSVTTEMIFDNDDLRQAKQEEIM